MSYQDFNYEDALHLIKASLFDICEDQERVIGSTEEEKRQIQIEKYIKMKDTAIHLIEDIYDLYPKNKSQEKANNNKERSQNFDEKVKVVELPPLEKDLEVEKKFAEQESLQKDQIEEGTNIPLEGEDHKVPLKEKEENNINNDELEKEETLKNESSTESEKFFLDDRNGTKPNFAYVPPSLFKVIKKNGTCVLTHHNSLKEEKLLFYKIDSEKPRGIIVREDQFMKLSLSKHRQEGVLKEAKIYRIEEAKKSREQRLKEEKEQWNAKVKSLKIA